MSDEEDARNNRPGPSNLGNRSLRKKHASNNEIGSNKNQDDHFKPSEMNEARQPILPWEWRMKLLTKPS